MPTALVSGACRLSLRGVDCSAQAIDARQTPPHMQQGALLFAPELKVESATLVDGGRSVRLEDDDGRALLGVVSPMVELVVRAAVHRSFRLLRRRGAARQERPVQLPWLRRRELGLRGGR